VGGGVQEIGEGEEEIIGLSRPTRLRTVEGLAITACRHRIVSRIDLCGDGTEVKHFVEGAADESLIYPARLNRRIQR
jgi:hypothetical protein